MDYYCFVQEKDGFPEVSDHKMDTKCQGECIEGYADWMLMLSKMIFLGENINRVKGFYVEKLGIILLCRLVCTKFCANSILAIPSFSI